MERKLCPRAVGLFGAVKASVLHTVIYGFVVKRCSVLCCHLIKIRLKLAGWSETDQLMLLFFSPFIFSALYTPQFTVQKKYSWKLRKPYRIEYILDMQNSKTATAVEGNNGFLSALLCNWILIGQSNHSTTSGNGAFAHFEVGGKNAHIWPDKAVFTEMNFVQSGSEKKKKWHLEAFRRDFGGKRSGVPPGTGLVSKLLLCTT